ncbi:MAG TPA: hypothetical protein VL461_09210 [Dictyobacter sp.]|nr:hypothetical protein [Dictyobacter sp.]
MQKIFYRRSFVVGLVMLLAICTLIVSSQPATFAQVQPQVQQENVAQPLVQQENVVQHAGLATMPTLQTARDDVSLRAAPTVIPDNVLVRIRMVTRTQGWALTNSAILKTFDGGRTWMNVTPKGAVIGFRPVAEFLNMHQVWVGSYDVAHKCGVVLSTTDGGVHWRSVVIRGITTYGYGVYSIQFVDAHHGTITFGAHEGMDKSSFDLFSTADGGRSWHKVFSADAKNGVYAGNKTGYSFKDTKAGWIGADIPGLQPLLYVTWNGGRTWQAQRLPLPEGSQAMAQAVTAAPAFFGQTGILPAHFYDGSVQHEVIYTTHNGGHSWRVSSINNFTSNSVYALDPYHLYATDTTYQRSLATAFYASNDGGRRWSRLARLPQSVGSLSFVNTRYGWGIRQLDAEHALLERTTDGGHTWHEISYTIH